MSRHWEQKGRRAGTCPSPAPVTGAPASSPSAPAHSSPALLLRVPPLAPSAAMLVSQNHDMNTAASNSAPSPRTAGPPGDTRATPYGTGVHESTTRLDGDERRAAPRRDPGTASPAPPRRTPSSAARSCFTCVPGFWRRGDRGDPREEDGTVTQTPRRRGRQRLVWRRRHRQVWYSPEVVPSRCHSTFCFLFKQGRSSDASIDLQHREFPGSLPARSSLPARPPAVCKFRGNRIYSTY